MTKEDAQRYAVAAMTKLGVPFAVAKENEDGTWRVEMVA